MVERVFDRVKHYRRAATRHLPEKTQPKTQLVQTHANTNTSAPALRQSSGYDWQI